MTSAAIESKKDRRSSDANAAPFSAECSSRSTVFYLVRPPDDWVVITQLREQLYAIEAAQEAEENAKAVQEALEKGAPPSWRSPSRGALLRSPARRVPVPDRDLLSVGAAR